MKEWLQSLAPRERLALLGGGLVALAVLLYLVLIEPAMKAYEAREERVAALERELEWMRGAAAELRALGGAAQADAGGSGRPPYLVVDRALRRAELPRPETLEPVGSEGARVELEAVAFDPLIALLQRLSAREGLQVTRARLRRTEPGRVDAGLSLERTR